MLRQALDDAAQQQDQQQQQQLERQQNERDQSQQQEATETDSLIPSNQQDRQQQNYATTAAPSSVTTNANTDLNHDAEQDGNDSQYYDDEDDDDDEASGDWDHQPPPEDTLFQKIWKGIKGCIILVVNVENLWDSPSMNEDTTTRTTTTQRSRKNHLIVLFWFFILASMYASERSSFKFLVDRACPFRLISIQMVTFCHALMVGLGMFLSAVSRKDFTIQPLGLPIVDVGLMALLDTVHLLLVFLTGPHVSPTLTAILVQFTLPLTALITQFVHPDGFCARRCCRRQSSSSANNSSQSNNDSTASSTQQRHSATSTGTNGGNTEEVDSIAGSAIKGCGGLSLQHILGSVVLTLAVLLALSPAMYSILDPYFFVYADPIPIRTAYNTFLFVSSCVPAAASQLYKEHIFLQYKQPVQSDYLNFILSIFQFIFASIMSPLVYTLQGLKATDDWPNLYPSSEFSQNFVDGIKCFLGILDEDRALNGYYDEANCKFTLALVLLHCFSIIAVGVAVDKIVNAGATRVMYRGVSAGIIFAVLSLYVYDMHIPDWSYGPAIDSLNLVCVILLVVGAELYHRVSLQDATFETVFPEIDNFYDDE